MTILKSVLMMKEIVLFSLTLLICSNIYSQEINNYSSANGSFTLTSQEYLNNIEKQYNIDVQSQSNVKLDVNIDVEKDWDMLYIYECDNSFSNLILVKTVTGKMLDTYTSMSTNGKVVVKFVSDKGTCGVDGYNGYTVNFSRITLPTVTIQENNSLSTTSTIKIGEEQNLPNLHITDRISKNLGGVNNVNDYSKSMILLESEYSSKLGLSYNKISSNDLLEVNSEETLYFKSKAHNINTNYFSVSTPIMKDAFVVLTSGHVKFQRPIDLEYNQWMGVGGGWEVGKVRIYMLATDKHAYIDFKDNLSFRADNPGVSPLTLQGDGNVAIGYVTSYATDGSQYRTEGNKLAVNGSTLIKGDIKSEGKIIAKEILVEANGNTADFVFSDDYQLKDLKEVEAYIKEHKCLPEIPNAETMEEQGVNLAEMNKLLLQKVEELTLHTIAQEKKLMNKDKEVQELKESRSREQEEREKLENEVSLVKNELKELKGMIINLNKK